MSKEVRSDLFIQNNKKSWIIILGAAIASFLLYNILPDSFGSNANKGLSLLLFVAVLWLSEVVHISITAVMIPFLAVIIGVGKTMEDGSVKAITIGQALSNFSSPTIFLFFGGFALATALNVQKLDRKIAMKLVSLAGGNLGVSIFLICAVTAGLSMWISNTATAAMMLPLVIGLTSQLDKEKDRNVFVFTLLAVAYSASIGGLGTIVGSPPNAITSIALGYSFADWMKVGLPMMLILWPVMFVVLYFVFRPNLKQKIAMDIDEHIEWNLPRVLTVIVFLITAFCWIFSKKLTVLIGINFSDAFVALGAVAAIGVLGLATWHDIAENTDWGVLLLFGGGLALSKVLGDSGASLVLGNQVAEIFGFASPLVIIFVVCVFIIILTEFTSNTASAALLVPIFATIAEQMGLPKETLVIVIGIGASCAFMLPVATPPNALVFGTGLIKQREMIKAGAVLNVVCVIIITTFIYLFIY
ncbi:MAG: DASS family sodium-coupled anion symporter [Campylobacter sp.]|nr:DASS family sodium-coupled anion symporter [Campylobacter sp.]